MQSLKYFAQVLFPMIGTTWKGGSIKVVSFIFVPLAKSHPYVQCKQHMLGLGTSRTCWLHLVQMVKTAQNKWLGDN